MSDDANRQRIAALEAQIAAQAAELEALRALDQAPPRQGVSATQESSISDVQQFHGNHNMVLKQITVADGGTLVVGDSPALPPDAAAIQQALVIYLSTLLNHYRLLSFQGLSSSAQRRHAQIALQAVFINVPTNVQVPELHALTSRLQQRVANSIRQKEAPLEEPFVFAQLSLDARQWLAELVDIEIYQALQADQVPTIDAAFLTGPRTALELIRHHRALVLTGDPGSGKTTVLRYLALNLAWARLHADQPDVTLGLPWRGPLPLPILVQLRRFADDLTSEPLGADSLVQHLEQIISSQRLPALNGYIVRQLEAGELLVLLDGLDEVADPRKRRWALQAIEAFQARFSQSRLVVTSRIYAYVPPFQLNDHFSVAQLQPLPEEDQDDFIARWYRAALAQHAEAAQAAARARDLIGAIRQRPRLREIAQNPLLLTLMTLLHFGEATTLPDQRAELYEKCLLLLLDEWDSLKAGGSVQEALGVTLQRSDLLPLIQPIAFELQQRGREEASLREVKAWALERFCNLTDGNANAAKTLIGRFLDLVETRSGVLIARDVRDRYAFPHRTFQEYLAMREVLHQNVVQREVLAQRHNPTWREVLLLLVGHLVRSSSTALAKEVIGLLLEADPAGTVGHFRNVALAGEMIEELGKTLDRTGRILKQEVVAELVALVQGGHLTANERVSAAVTLGRLGDPRLPTPDQDAYWCHCAAGPCWFGDDLNGDLQQITLPDDFKIGRYPVTNAEYARFVAAGGYADVRWWTPQGWTFVQPGGHPWDDQAVWLTQPRHWDDATYNQPTQPVVGVSWYEAAAYAAWVSAEVGAVVRLPTSLEWERAARGGDQRRYPWGAAAPTPEHANYQETGIGQPSPVGCFPEGQAACGALDLIGNVQEWMATLYEDQAALNPLTDCEPSDRVSLSYSDFRDRTNVLHCGARNWFSPNFRIYYGGFRLVFPSR